VGLEQIKRFQAAYNRLWPSEGEPKRHYPAGGLPENVPVSD